MAQPYPLSNVIRQVAAGIRAASSSEKIVIIDGGTGKAMKNKPWWRDVKYYLVDHRNVAECKLPVFHLKDFERDCTIRIAASYRASCAPGCEEKLAEALFDEEYPHPGAVLEKLIREWISEENHAGLEIFLTDYLRDRTKLAERLGERARLEAGLNLVIRLQVEEEKLIQTTDLGPLDIPVRVTDHATEQRLTLERIPLEVDDRNRTYAILYHARNYLLEDVVRREVQKYFAEHVSLHEFCTVLHQESFKTGLISHLNEALSPVGRRVRTIFLDNKNDEQVRPTVHLKKCVACEVQKYPAPIEINNTVQLSLSNLAKYRESGSPDLEKWLEENLQRVVSDVLFDATYIDLLVEFRPKEEEIKRRLKDEAREIGYEIRQLIAIPDLEPIKWKENFTITPEGTFETNDPKVHVKLRIVITARINDLKQVEKYLNRQQNVPKLMEEAVISRLRRYLHGVGPDRFYLRFYHTDKEGEPTVEKALETEAREELKEFQAEVIDVIPKPLDTEITQRLNELLKKTSSFELKITPLKGGESITFQGSFYVEGVSENGWYKLQLREFSLEDIKHALERYLRSRLNTRTYQELLYKDLDGLNEIEEEVKRLARHCVQEDFGLAVSISVVERDRTDIEQGATNIQIARIKASLEKEQHFIDQGAQAEIEENEATLNQLRKLLQEREEILTQAGNEEELRELDEKIRQTKERLKPAQTLAISAVNQKYLPGGEWLAEQGGKEEQ